MEERPPFRALPLVIAACCGAIIAIALFGNGRWPLPRDNAVDLAGDVGGTLSGALKTYACPQCGRMIEWGNDFCTWCGWDSLRLLNPAALNAPPTQGPAVGQETEVEVNAEPNPAPTPVAAPVGPAPAANLAQPAPAPVASMTPVAAAAPATPPGVLSPREQNAAGKEFIEGHWLGLEVIPLTPELAKEYQVPTGESGILVDEITLEAAESGILAGDMVQSVEGRPTPDLKAFFVATQRIQEKERADVGVSRRGQKMSFFMEARNTTTLGFAQMEAAQPIKPGSISPHRSRNKACTECHIIMQTGGQLPTDAGDILPTPPAITKAAIATHGDRGQCVTCHVIR